MTEGDLNRALVVVVLVGRDLEVAGSGVLSAKEAWNPCEERLLARVVDLVCPAMSGDARHGDKGSPSSEPMMEAFFFMALAFDFLLSRGTGAV